MVAQSSDLLPIVDGPERSLLVHTWGDRSGRFGDSRPTVMQLVRVDEFPAVSGIEPLRLLHEGHCWSDEGQPSSVQLPNKRVFTVYYDACAGYIGGTFSALSGPDSPEPCQGPPPPPTLKLVSNRGRVVAFEWSGPPRTRISYILEAGRTPGANDVTSIDRGSARTYSATQVSPGTYYVRVRSTSGCGTSDASNEVVVVVR